MAMKKVTVVEEISVLDAILADVGDDGETRTTLDKLSAAVNKVRAFSRSAEKKDETVAELEEELATLRTQMQESMDPTKLADTNSIAKMHEIATKLKSAQAQVDKRREAIATAEQDSIELIGAIRDLANALYDEAHGQVPVEVQEVA